MKKVALTPEQHPKEPFGQRLTWAIPVSVVILLLGGWWMILSNLRSLQSSISAAFQESQLRTAQASARAIELYETINIDFIDGYIAAVMEKEGISELYSFDRKHIARLKGVSRKEP